MKDESSEKKKVFVVKKKECITMKNTNKTTETQRKYEEMQASEAPGLSFNETEEISDTDIRSIYKANEKTSHNIRTKCPNILYVESITDKGVYEKFTNSDNTFLKPINPEEDLEQAERDIIIGNLGKKCGFKDAIIYRVARNASLKESQKEDSPYYPSKTFYGIVDMDYDKNDREIKIICGKIKEQTDICRKQLSTTSPANDIETLLFSFKENEILSLCSNEYIPYQYKEPIQEFWKQLIEIAKQKAVKLGAMRKKSVTNSRKNALNEDGKTNRSAINFQKFFPHGIPEKYMEYANCNNEEEKYLDNIVKTDFYNKNKERKDFLEIAINNNKRARNNCNETNKLNYCRGHDLLGILSCLMQKEMMPEKSVADIQKKLTDDLISLVNSNDFDGADFKEFIKQNDL